MRINTFDRGLLLGLVLVVGMPLSAAAKCPGIRPMGKPLRVIDGRQATEAEAAALNLSWDSIQQTYRLCWSSTDSTFITSEARPTFLTLEEYYRAPKGVVVIGVVTRALFDRLVAELYRASDAAARSHTSPHTLSLAG